MNRWLHEVSKPVTRGILRVLFRFRVESPMPATAGPTVIVANHSSYLDPAIVGSTCPRQCHFFARESLRRIPLVGRWMAAVGTVFVDRDAPATAALQQLLDVLREGGAVIVFPEGTRSVDGRVAPFKRGVLLLVKKTGATVVPAGVRGSFEAFPRGRRFPRLFRRCSIAYGAEMRADEVTADGGLDELRRRVALLSGYPQSDAVPPATPTPRPSSTDPGPQRRVLDSPAR